MWTNSRVWNLFNATRVRIVAYCVGQIIYLKVIAIDEQVHNQYSNRRMRMTIIKYNNCFFFLWWSLVTPINTMESWFFEPPKGAEIASNNREVQKTEGLKNRESTVLLVKKCSSFPLLETLSSNLITAW